MLKAKSIGNDTTYREGAKMSNTK